MFPSVFTRLPEENEAAFTGYRSLILRLFESFKYLYEPLGKHPAPEQGEPHMFPVVKRAMAVGAANLDGSPIHLPNDRDPFGEESHAHLIRSLACGLSWGHYPVAGDHLGGWHNGGDEILITEMFPLLAVAPLSEVGGYVFPTDYNYFEESANRTCLHNPRYDHKPHPPLYEPGFSQYFEEANLKRLGISPTLPSCDFGYMAEASSQKDIRLIHFAVKLLYSGILMESAMRDLFGISNTRAGKITHIDTIWGNPNLNRQLSHHHLAVLSSLLAPLHYVAYAFTYALYRNKFGVSYLTHYPEGKSIHGGWYFGRDKNRVPLKFALRDAIGRKILDWKKQLASLETLTPTDEQAEQIQTLHTLMENAVALAAYFGVGYTTSSAHKKNPHVDTPHEFAPGYTAHHNPKSLFFNFWPAYTGDFFTGAELHNILHNNRIGKIAKSPWGILLTHSYRFIRDYYTQIGPEKYEAYMAEMKRLLSDN